MGTLAFSSLETQPMNSMWQYKPSCYCERHEISGNVITLFQKVGSLCTSSTIFQPIETFGISVPKNK